MERAKATAVTDKWLFFNFASLLSVPLLRLISSPLSPILLSAILYTCLFSLLFTPLSTLVSSPLYPILLSSIHSFLLYDRPWVCIHMFTHIRGKCKEEKRKVCILVVHHKFMESKLQSIQMKWSFQKHPFNWKQTNKFRSKSKFRDLMGRIRLSHKKPRLHFLIQLGWDPSAESYAIPSGSDLDQVVDSLTYCHLASFFSC